MSFLSLLRTIPKTMCFIAPKLSATEPLVTTMNCNLHHMCRMEYPFNMANMSTNQVNSVFLQSSLPMYNISRGLKMKTILHRRCKSCLLMWKNDRKFIICKAKPRHNQVERKKKEYKTWIIASASQSKVREW